MEMNSIHGWMKWISKGGAVEKGFTSGRLTVMGSRGLNQFSFIVTSDGSMKEFPSNRSSSFQIQLEKPLDFEDGEWEVALEYVNYPFSWMNLGNVAGTFFKYYYNDKNGVQEIHFPNWLCTDMGKVLKFMQSSINKSIGEGKIAIGLDSLDCFKITCDSLDFDVGFSWQLMKLLGLSGGEFAEKMSMEEFDRRSKFRNFLRRIWRKPFDYGNENLRWNILDCLKMKSFKHFTSLIMSMVDFQSLRDARLESFESDDFQDDPEWSGLFRSIYEREVDEYQNQKYAVAREMVLDMVGPESPDEEAQEKTYLESVAFIYDIMIVWYYLYKLYTEKVLPWRKIKGSVPGNLNSVERMFIYTNIIEPVDFNSKSSRLLRMINTRGDPFQTTHEEFVKPIYLPVQKGKLSVIEVYITDASGKQVPFQTGTLVLMLHFRRSFGTFNKTTFRYF
jgi:hypothetical protein